MSRQAFFVLTYGSTGVDVLFTQSNVLRDFMLFAQKRLLHNPVILCLLRTLPRGGLLKGDLQNKT